MGETAKRLLGGYFQILPKTYILISVHWWKYQKVDSTKIPHLRLLSEAGVSRALGVIWVRVDVSAICSRMNIKISNPHHLSHCELLLPWWQEAFLRDRWILDESKQKYLFFQLEDVQAGNWKIHLWWKSTCWRQVGLPLHINLTGWSSCDVTKETLLTDVTHNEPFLHPAEWWRSKTDFCLNTFHWLCACTTATHNGWGSIYTSFTPWDRLADEIHLFWLAAWYLCRTIVLLLRSFLGSYIKKVYFRECARKTSLKSKFHISHLNFVFHPYLISYCISPSIFHIGSKKPENGFSHGVCQ